MITLHPEEKTPLYEQLYAALAADIAGFLAAAWTVRWMF